MKVVVLLADSAQGDGLSGKVHALGIGWTATSSPTAPMAVIVVITFGDEEGVDEPHTLTLALVDGDRNVLPVGPEGRPLHVEAELVVNRASDSPPGAPIVATFVLNVGPGIPLEPGRLYRWQASIDDQAPPEWAASFVTRSELASS